MSIRVIQWSTGNVGQHAVRAIVENPDLKLVGCYTYGAAKDGKDVGEICGIGKIGVKATNSLDKLLKTKADVVIHTPLPSLVYGDNPDLDMDVMCKLLASGKHVITTVGYMYPKVYGPALMRRLTKACKIGNSTFHSTGLNPGWLGDLLPLFMSGMSARIDKVHVTEISDFAFYPSPEIMFDMMGFGKTPAVFKSQGQRRAFWLNGLFRESVQMVADGLGIKLDRIREETELDVAAKAYDVASGPLAKGTVAGQHWIWAGQQGRKDVVVHETVWRMGPEVGKNWPTGKHSVVIEGAPNMRIEFDPFWISDGLQGTGVHAVNAIPQVMAAGPGVKTFLDMPMIMGYKAGPKPAKKKAAKKAAKKKAGKKK